MIAGLATFEYALSFLTMQSVSMNRLRFSGASSLSASDQCLLIVPFSTGRKRQERQVSS